MKNLIAISGKSGCGNTSVGKLVSQKLGIDFVNFTFRNLALEKGLRLEDAILLAGNDYSWDREIDKRQVELARKSGRGCVLSSRLAIWMLEEAELKVYLEASPEIRAERIVRREGGSLVEKASFTARRDALDHERYLKLYNIDNDNYSFADLIIDTGNITIEEAAQRIVESLKLKVEKE